MYLYIYGNTDDNEYLGYRESARITAAHDTTVWLEVTSLATTEMRELTLGVYHYGEGTARIDPPNIVRLPVVSGHPAPRITEYLDTFFALATKWALDRDRLDWDKLRQDAYSLSAGADSVAEVHEVIDFTLRRIHRHAYLQPPREHQDWARGNNDQDAIDPSLVYPTGRRVDDRMVYLNMPGVSSGHDKTLRAYADSLNRLIARLDSPTTDEWVLDLRDNTGGNCWAMLAGIGPLLGEGRCGYFMQRDGSNASSWWYWEGGSWNGRQQQLTLRKPYVLHDTARVAVLYGPKTASSGEVVAVAFRGRPNTRSFGQATGGFSTGNSIFYLPDEAAVLLTVSVYGDRDKTPFGDSIPPDEVVLPQRGIDAAAEAAASWLRRGR